MIRTFTFSLQNQNTIGFLILLLTAICDNQQFVYKLKKNEKDTTHLLRIQTMHVIAQIWTNVMQVVDTVQSYNSPIAICVHNALWLYGLDIFTGRHIKVGLLGLLISQVAFYIVNNNTDMYIQQVQINININILIFTFLLFNSSFLKEKLFEQNERISFQFNLSHDLRNYVTSINPEDMNPVEYEKQTEYIAQSLNKMYHFELLFISKQGFKQKHLKNKEQMHLIAERCSNLFIYKDNKIKFNVIEKRPSLSADEKLLTYLFDFVLLKMHEVGFVNITVNIELRNENERCQTLDLKFKYDLQLKNKDISVILESNILKKLMSSVAKDVTYRHQFDLAKNELCIEFLFSNDGVNSITGDYKIQYEIVVKGDDLVPTSNNGNNAVNNTNTNNRNGNNENNNNLLLRTQTDVDNTTDSPDLIEHPNNKLSDKLNSNMNSYNTQTHESILVDTVNIDNIQVNINNNNKNQLAVNQSNIDINNINVPISISKSNNYKSADGSDISQISAQNVSPTPMVVQNHLPSANGQPIVHQHLSGIYINVDDENCVLKMNARMFKKSGITINQCKNRIEFLELLTTISSNRDLAAMNLKILMDHVLDRDQGYLVISAGQELNIKRKLGLQMQFVLVSSSESDDVTNKYFEVGVNNIFPKPLTLDKLREFVSQSSFIQPCEPMSKSGGTASMFKVTYIDESIDQYSNKNINYWLGKDIDRAYEEVMFQDKIKEIKKSYNGKEKKLLYPRDFGLLDHAMEQFGTVNLNCGNKTKNLMLIKNQRSGVQRLRFLDIKLGAQTAVGGWQGKGHLGAFLQQTFVDNFTNTFQEGYRLEGFDEPPYSLASRKFVRKDLQRMPGLNIMKYMIDFKDVNKVKSQHLYGKHIMNTYVKKMFSIVSKAKSCKVPQKWIGSSIGFLFEVEDFPLDFTNQDPTVVLFDWGRCVLVNEEEYNSQNHVDKIDRYEFWLYQCESLKRLSYECAYLQYHKYCMKFSSIEMVLILGDEMGSVSILSDQIDDLLDKEMDMHLETNAERGTTTCAPKQDIPLKFRITKIDNSQIYRLNVINADYVPVFLDITGFQHCYVRINFKMGDTVIYSEETAYSEERIKPTWNEYFDFEMKTDDINKREFNKNLVEHLKDFKENSVDDQFNIPSQDKYNTDF